MNYDYKTVKDKWTLIIKELGGLPQIKVHCSVLGNQALKKAIENYKNKGEKMEEKKNITKETKIGEALTICPKCADILVGEGMHCPFCPGAAMETLEEGLKMHGKTEKEIEEIIKKMNDLLVN